jgi:hypothetical protein
VSRSDVNHLQDGFCCSQNWWKSLWVFCRENAFVVVVFALKKSNKKQAILLLLSCSFLVFILKG